MTGKSRAVFFDRDGTINEDIGYVSKPENFKMLPGVRPSIMLLQDLGFKIFIVSNQSGVGRGIFTEKDLVKVDQKMFQLFQEDEIELDGVRYCLHRPEEGCQCRKPEPKMVLDLAKKAHVDLSKSYFIGDKISDVLTGKNAGCRTVLLLAEDDSIQLDEDDDAWPFPDFVAENVKASTEWILKDSGVLDAVKETMGLGKKQKGKTALSA